MERFTFPPRSTRSQIFVRRFELSGSRFNVTAFPPKTRDERRPLRIAVHQRGQREAHAGVVLMLATMSSGLSIPGPP